MIIRQIVAAAALGVAAMGAQAAVVKYATESSFLTAAGGGLSFEGFETVTAPTSTSVGFSGGTFSCAGGSYCPGFFGISGIALEGVQSVFFASPDSAKFTFSSAITAFSIFIGGAGDVAPITLTASTSAGDSVAALSNFSNSSGSFAGNSQFFGITSSVAFTSITFTPSNSGDGIFFDAMRFGTADTTVPVPGTLPLVALGGLALVAARRRAA